MENSNTVLLSRIVNFSCRLGSNIIDWLRSIYFSVTLSAILASFSKFHNADAITVCLFFAANFLFALGFYLSIKIANRFKNHEKNYDSTGKKDLIEEYYFKREKELNTQFKLLIQERKNNRKLSFPFLNLYIHIDYGFQHLFFYSLFPIALFIFIYTGYQYETKSSKKNIGLSIELNVIEKKIGTIDSTLREIKNLNNQIVHYFDSSRMSAKYHKLEAINIDSSFPKRKVTNIPNK